MKDQFEITAFKSIRGNIYTKNEAGKFINEDYGNTSISLNSMLKVGLCYESGDFIIYSVQNLTTKEKIIVGDIVILNKSTKGILERIALMEDGRIYFYLRNDAGCADNITKA